MVNYFIGRPIFASAIAFVMVLAGAIYFPFLPVSQFPDITPPQVVVTAQYPGASAQVVADTVTTPLEQQINGVEGMMYMSSTSSNDGTATITVTFEVGYSLAIAAVDVQNRVSQASSILPPIVNQGGVVIRKQNFNFALIIDLTSPDGSVDATTLSNYAYLQILDPLKRLPGVGDVQIYGERRYSMRIWLDPDRLASLGITAIDVQQAITEQNVQVAAGKIGQSPAPAGTAFEAQVNAQGRLGDPQEFGEIIIRTNPSDGSMVRLRDVARVELGALQYSSSSNFAGRPAVVLAIFQSPGSNAIALKSTIQSKMEEMKGRFPKGIAYGINYDTTRFVSAAMADVVETLAEALLLVVIVVFVFLQNWRATLIPVIAIPVSLIASLAVMGALGFSLNMPSLLGMVLAIGLVVDDAIVVVENVERQLADGHPPVAAARLAMQEVTMPIVATTAVLMAVFIPVAFLPGISGRLYNQFALTVAISFGISAFNSLTLSPALAAAFLRPGHTPTFAPARRFNAGFERLSRGYAHLVERLLRARRTVAVLFVAGLAATYALATRVPSTFLPVEDQGFFFVVVQLPEGASLERTERIVDRIRDRVEKQAGVRIVGSITGLNQMTGAAQSNAAVMFAILDDWAERSADRKVSALVHDLQNDLTAVTEGIVVGIEPPSVPGLGAVGGFQFQIEDLAGAGPTALNEAAQVVLAEARKRPEIAAGSLVTPFSISTPQYYFDLDRTKAKLLDLKLQDIFSTLQIYLGSLYVNDFNAYGRNFRVTLQADQAERATMKDFGKLHVRNGAGAMVPLSTLGRLVPAVGPETISHYNNYASALIVGAPAAGYSSGQAVAAMERAARAVLPQGFTYEWTGITLQELRAQAITLIVFGLATLFVFVILAAQYESFVLPFVIILTVPLALLGALGALWLRGMPIDIYGQIGFVMLIGLAAKNAILMVEFANRRMADGLSCEAAALEAARLRLRPILMTAFAFILGVVPLVLASGAGAVSRQSLGTTVFGGMLVATLLGLLFVPVFYAILTDLKKPRPRIAPVAEALGASARPTDAR